MLTLADLRRVFRGLMGLVRFDLAAIDLFDSSPAGFWKSFWIGPLLAPGLAAAIIAHLWNDSVANPTMFVVWQVVAYVIGLVAFPLVMLPISRHFERRHRYARYVTVYNWIQLPELLLSLPIELLAVTHALPPEPLVVLWLIVRSTLFVYEWYIAKVTLEIEAISAMGLVAIDFLLGLLIGRVAELLT
jgi:hypothetical protein